MPNGSTTAALTYVNINKSFSSLIQGICPFPHPIRTGLPKVSRQFVLRERSARVVLFD